MPIPLPQSVKKLLQDKAYGHVVTYNDEGSVQLTMVWMDVEGDEVLFQHIGGAAQVSEPGSRSTYHRLRTSIRSLSLGKSG